jgi:hypothetical protein
MAQSSTQKHKIQKVDHARAKPSAKKRVNQASIDLDAAMVACQGYEIFSKAVLVGMQKRGSSLKDVSRITGLSKPHLELVLKEKAIFEDSVIVAIESATGLSSGQLALLSLDNPDPQLVAIMTGHAGLGQP